ncbi:helix-turn-helix domain-containing protein [Arthrobacter woluwensis]|uniref:helix-turn-helix domain-containing protein n=1 Tax=Arthrobacter woluwensis TaxID=156980 RepID=UPI001AAFDCE7|nr:helix-turn-helix domain-containing protein [Arthrobacter woluwensis]QTF73078.1 helix-turn-helix domain-containing protein [Arthrobacter woluwensis]
MSRTFGKRLRAERISRGLTQEQLGGAECSHSYISLLERGDREPSAEILSGLARKLGMLPGDLEQWALQPTVQDQEYSLSALHAWCARDIGDFDAAAHHALVAAQFARESRKEAAVCEMNLLRVECLARLGRYEQGRNLVDMLLSDGLISGNAGLRSEALQLSARMALAEQCFHDAAGQAQESVEQSAGMADDSMVRLAAQHLSIRALLREGHKEAAWRRCALLEDAVPDHVPSHLRGRLAWVVGDVAFARGDVGIGVERHEQAVGLLLPQVDLQEWITFNMDSARARLEAGVADQATRSCLDRAGAALTIMSLGDEAVREFAFLDALWLHSSGCHTQAADRLTCFEERPLRMSRLWAEASFLRGRILLTVGEAERALVDLALAQEGFFRLRNLRGAQAVADLILDITRTRYEDAGQSFAHSAAS